MRENKDTYDNKIPYGTFVGDSSNNSGTDKMIELIKIINQPYSGEFEERIYDHNGSWNSQYWTYVKFTNKDYSEWCGVFRGRPRNAEISKIKKEALILTSDYLWKIDTRNGETIEFEDTPKYQNLTVAPNGDFILSDYYSIYRVNGAIKDIKSLNSPIRMDMINFKNWEEQRLIIECDEFMNWERKVTLELDSSNWTIKIKTNHNTL